MPKYQYRCADCGEEFEQYQRFADDALTVCPSCNGSIRRVIQPVGVVFKGSGWYINDSRKSESTTSSASTEKTPSKNESDKAPATTDAAPKPESKPEAKESSTATKPASEAKVAASA